MGKVRHEISMKVTKMLNSFAIFWICFFYFFCVAKKFSWEARGRVLWVYRVMNGTKEIESWGFLLV